MQTSGRKPKLEKVDTLSTQEERNKMEEPGRTPGSAEGEREPVEKSLRKKNRS